MSGWKRLDPEAPPEPPFAYVTEVLSRDFENLRVVAALTGGFVWTPEHLEVSLPLLTLPYHRPIWWTPIPIKKVSPQMYGSARAGSDVIMSDERMTP